MVSLLIYISLANIFLSQTLIAVGAESDTRDE